jgi:hypothetical protein
MFELAEQYDMSGDEDVPGCLETQVGQGLVSTCNREELSGNIRSSVSLGDMAVQRQEGNHELRKEGDTSDSDHGISLSQSSFLTTLSRTEVTPKRKYQSVSRIKKKTPDTRNKKKKFCSYELAKKIECCPEGDKHLRCTDFTRKVYAKCQDFAMSMHQDEFRTWAVQKIQNSANNEVHILSMKATLTDWSCFLLDV